MPNTVRDALGVHIALNTHQTQIETQSSAHHPFHVHLQHFCWPLQSSRQTWQADAKFRYLWHCAWPCIMRPRIGAKHVNNQGHRRRRPPHFLSPTRHSTTQQHLSQSYLVGFSVRFWIASLSCDVTASAISVKAPHTCQKCLEGGLPRLESYMHPSKSLNNKHC
jgi:hypothetical protein